MKYYLNQMDCIMPTSENYLNTSGVLNNIKEKSKLRVIPLGIGDSVRDYSNDIINDVLEQFGLRDNNYVFSLGVLRYYKGFHHLVEAAKNTDEIIVIAGSGPEEHRLKSLVNKLDLNNVVFTGQLDEKQKHILMKAAKLFVLPSHLRSEAFGMVLVEASMYGKPMVTCEIGTGTSFVNLHEVTGLVIEPNRPELIAGGINKLCQNPILLNKYSKNARERYENLFSSEVLGYEHKELYASLVV